MDFFVTTYQKDYRWPHVKTSDQLAATVALPPAQHVRGIPHFCGCGSRPGDNRPSSGTGFRIDGDSYEWSRLGPMGPLLDPKLYPVNGGSRPENDCRTMDQSETCLKKLQDKYPHLSDILQNTRTDLINRSNNERLKTTYQIDYCKRNVSTVNDNAMVADRFESITDRQRAPRSSDTNNKSNTNSRSSSASDKFRSIARRDSKEPDGPNTMKPSWKTEYADAIGKAGSRQNEMIMNLNLC